MSAKTCISLVLTILVLALAGGNPFLRPPARAGSSPLPAPVPLVAGGGSVRLVDNRDGLAVYREPAYRDPVENDAVATKLVQFEECPDPALRSQVVAVHNDAAGRAVWLLQDGRAVRRNAAYDPRHPKLQPLLLFEAPATAQPRLK